MRNPPRPPPSPARLQEMRLHEAVRDYPELVPRLLEAGVSLEERGCDSLAAVWAEVGGEDMDALLSHLSWRKCTGEER